MLLPDILDALIEAGHIEHAMKVVALCWRRIDDALRACLALAAIFPEHAFAIAETASKELPVLGD